MFTCQVFTYQSLLVIKSASLDDNFSINKTEYFQFLSPLHRELFLVWDQFETLLNKNIDLNT